MMSASSNFRTNLRGSFCSLAFCAVGVLAALESGLSPAQAQEFFGPGYGANNQAIEGVDAAGANGGAGYFPTYNDTLYSEGYQGQSGDYGRATGYGFGNEGPDRVSVTRDGLWDYDDPEPNFYQRHDMMFRPIDHVLGVFGHNELVAFETPDNHSGVVEVDLMAPIGVTRNYDPERAHAKFGPAYFDLLYVGAGVLFSDYSGVPVLAEDDGWIGILEMGVRGAARVTDSLYIVMTANFFYLPFEDQWGVDLSDLSGGAFVQAGFEFQTGPVDWLVYDQFNATAPFFDLFSSLEKGEVDTSGRYRFGYEEGFARTTQYFDDDFLYFVNRVGLSGTTPLLNDKWRLQTDVYRRDWWRTMDFEDQDKSYHFDALLGFEGDAWFAPFARYNYSGYDDFDSNYHRAYAGVTGLLSENVSLQAQGGYIWSDTKNAAADLDSWLWSVSLQHTINRDANHYITFGQDYAESTIGDVAVVDYVQYGLQHRIGPRISSGLFVQYGESEVVRPFTGHTSHLAAGGTLSFRPGDFTSVELRAYYQEFEDIDGTSLGALDRWVYSASVVQRIFSRTYATMDYQFEDTDGTLQNYQEHLFKMGLRTYF